MKKVFEAQANIHIPALKCSYQKGTRFTVEGDLIIVGDAETPMTNDFKILIKHGLLKELTAQ